MAEHPENCEICSRIQQCEDGTHPGLIMEMETGWAVMGDSQFFLGYTLLLCKQPVADLEELPPAFRLQFLAEMALLSQAVSRVVRPNKMNIESLGNKVPHLHWHLFPRQSFETQPEIPVWFLLPEGDQAQRFALEPAKHDALREAIRDELTRLLGA